MLLASLAKLFENMLLAWAIPVSYTRKSAYAISNDIKLLIN